MDYGREENINLKRPGLIEDKRGSVRSIKIDNDPDKVFDSKKMKKQFSNNIWMISSIILIVVIVLFFMDFDLGFNSKSVSKDVAGERLIKFIGSQGVEAELIEINDNGDFYEVFVSINGQQGSVFVTKDGEFFTTALIPLVGAAPAVNNQPTPSNSLVQCGY